MGLGIDKTKLLEKYGPYVRSLANGVRKQFNLRADIEDLVSYGQVGLFEAADRFDAKLGANFLTFAHYRIKGAIFDGLRKMGTFKGPEQRALYLSERATLYLENAAARDLGGPRTFSDDVREVESAVTNLAAIFAASLDGFDHLQIRDDAMSPEERLEQTEVKSRVKVAIEKLPENERKLLLVYYYEGKTLEEAGAAIGQSKSWASRLHARAIERLKSLLAEDMDVHAPTGKTAGAHAPNAPHAQPQAGSAHGGGAAAAAELLAAAAEAADAADAGRKPTRPAPAAQGRAGAAADKGPKPEAASPPRPLPRAGTR